MNRKIRHIFLFLSLFLLVMVNMRTIIWQGYFVVANIASMAGDHGMASTLFDMLDNHTDLPTTDKQKLVLNQANERYRLGQYTSSINAYLSLSGSRDADISFESNHNLGNTWYRF